ncbi:MAG: hypothetical protein IJ143_04815 [Neisseriaceae bacterium]|nr:hypothetical protein [Neisseriaceae bacterium]
MSHSKDRKRGFSWWIECRNRSIKKYIHYSQINSKVKQAAWRRQYK